VTSALPRIMLVTDRRLVRAFDLRPAVTRAVEGGVGLVHIRERDLDDVALARLVEDLRRDLPASTAIVLNGKLELARALGVGLHLPAALAIEGTSRPRPLGRSAHAADEVARARDEGVDYVLLGTVYATPSKPGRSGAGPELVRSVVARAANVPLYAIGGVNVTRIPELVRAGAYGVAACRALLEAKDPRRVAQAMLLALDVAAR
jgi:thiamine-phosphate pyrophosphorylase